jgi:hypothetical protein
VIEWHLLFFCRSSVVIFCDIYISCILRRHSLWNTVGHSG